MKQVFAMLLLLAVILSLACINAIYINNVAEETSKAVEALPDIGSADCARACASLRDDWNRRLPILNLTVSYTLTDRVCEQLALLTAAAEESDADGYAAARAILPDALEHLRRSDQISFRHVF